MPGGYCYGQPEPVCPCPWCGSPCEADFVDIGVGMMQCGPYHCHDCGASECGPNDDLESLTPEERSKGWRGPGREPSPDANVIHGRIVTAE